jgi:hypothetical protein
MFGELWKSRPEEALSTALIRHPFLHQLRVVSLLAVDGVGVETELENWKLISRKKRVVLSTHYDTFMLL